MGLGRRSMLKALGGVAVAGRSAAAAVAQSIVPGPVVVPVRADPVSGSIGGPVDALLHPEQRLAEIAIHRWHKAAQRRATRKLGTLDPDLAALGSTSLAWRNVKQQERDEAFQRRRRPYDKIMGWLAPGDVDD